VNFREYIYIGKTGNETTVECCGSDGQWQTKATELEITDAVLVSYWQPIQAIAPAGSELPSEVFYPAPEASEVACKVDLGHVQADNIKDPESTESIRLGFVSGSGLLGDVLLAGLELAGSSEIYGYSNDELSSGKAVEESRLRFYKALKAIELFAKGIADPPSVGTVTG
jgi:hypothetical protein